MTPQSSVQRFWSKVNKTKTCWLWTGLCCRDGYGKFMYTSAHRWAYVYFVGPIPSGFQIDHLCKNRACVNPSHLEIVSVRENIRRSTNQVAKFMQQTACIHGHKYTEINTILRVTDSGVWRACRLCKYEGVRRWRRKRKIRELGARTSRSTAGHISNVSLRVISSNVE